MSTPTLDDLRRALDALAAVDDLDAVLPEGEQVDCFECPVARWLSDRLDLTVAVSFYEFDGIEAAGAQMGCCDGTPVPLPERLARWFALFDLDGTRTS